MRKLSVFNKQKVMENFIHITNHVVHRMFLLFCFLLLCPLIKRYLHQKNTTHIKPYFLNQPHQPLGLGRKPWATTEILLLNLRVGVIILAPICSLLFISEQQAEGWRVALHDCSRSPAFYWSVTGALHCHWSAAA